MAENSIFAELINLFNLSLTKIVEQAITFIPELLVLTLLVIIGWLIGIVIKKIISKLLELATFDKWLEEQNLATALGGYKLSGIIGEITKWYIIAVFLMQGLAHLNIAVLQNSLFTAANFIPLLLVAVLIFVAGLLIARHIRNIIESTSYSFNKTIGIAAELAIIYISIVIALQTIGVNVAILISTFNIVIGAFLLAIAIILGIAFGFALKDDAKKVLENLKKA